jgi:hypothetical protein
MDTTTPQLGRTDQSDQVSTPPGEFHSMGALVLVRYDSLDVYDGAAALVAERRA